MIILPLEEKKPSIILKWIFRVLMISVIGGALFIFALNILSGTGEAHRRGLEQALSDIFKAPVKIGTLKAFNIFPIFHIEMENVRASYDQGNGEIRAGHVVLSFRFFDLMFGRDLIRDLQVTDLMITPHIIGEHWLRIESAGIVPAQSQADQPSFKMSGEYGGIPVEAVLALEGAGGIQPAYSVANNLPASLAFGKIGISGKFVQNDKGEPSIQNAEFVLEEKIIATGAVTLLTSRDSSGLQIDFQTPRSQGSLTTSVQPKSQVWNFEHLDLSDVMTDDPVWLNIFNALDSMGSFNGTEQEEGAVTRVDVSIKALTGNFTAENMRGTFIASSHMLTGWWDGVITTLAPQAEGVAPTGAVQCGLLSLRPDRDTWKTGQGLVFIEPASILTKLAINSTTGKIDWSPERVASGSKTTFNADLSPYIELKEKLAFPETHPCLSHLEKVSTP
jgi:hypothetical protein